MAITKVSRGLLSTGIVDNSNATAITIDSSEQVGIGIGSPSTPLHIKGAGDAYITIEAGAADGNVGLLFDNSSSTQKGALLYDTDDNYLLFNVNAAERMRITSGGDVCIGGSNDVHTSADIGPTLHILSDTSGVDVSLHLHPDVGEYSLYAYNGYLAILDHTANAERMRIDSSGDVLIGQTSQTGYTFAQKLVVGDGDANDGITIQSGSTHQGNLAFNAADGTTAHGRISYQHGSNYMQFFVNNTEEVRIQNGGGISFNGDTAAANALDDYEEGTATLTLSATTTAPTITQGNTFTINYTKIGNLVRFVGYTAIRNVTNAGTGIVKITGLPFAQAGSYYGHVTFTHSTMFSGDAPVGYIESGATYFYPVLMSSTSGVAYDTGTKYMMCQGVYHTA